MAMKASERRDINERRRMVFLPFLLVFVRKNALISGIRLEVYYTTDRYICQDMLGITFKIKPGMIL
jgi:hypothetical protein